MKKAIVLLLLFNVCWIAYPQNFNINLAGKLQAKLDELTIGNPNTKGMSAGVYVPGQGIWTGTSGLSHAGQIITSDMKMGLASNSKIFTSIVILILAENNIINLEDHLYKWLPAYKNIDPNVTIRQLLNHTSGIDDMFSTPAQIDSINKNPLRKWKPAEVLAWIGPMKFIPGSSYFYSNTNYILAGMVAEKASGKHLSKLIRDYILNPLQLNDTYYDVEELIPDPIAHRWYNSIDYHNISRNSLNTAGGPAGSMFSTPSDFLNLYIKLFEGQLINSNSLTQLTNFLTPGNYGLGISKITLLNKKVWGHGGNTLGYRSRMIYDPCMKFIICGLSNSNPSAVDGITASLYKVLIDFLPDCAGSISGISSVCQGQKSITYVVPPIVNATSYAWTLPNGFTGNSSTNSITINFDQAALSGNIIVKGQNTYGNGASSSMFVLVKPSPVATITPSGPTNFCSGSSVNLTASGGSSYMWSTGETTKTISISKAGNYSLTVTNVYGCKSLPVDSKIEVYSIPGVAEKIYGNVAPCVGAVQYYYIAKIPGATKYNWTIPQGSIILSGATTQVIKVLIGNQGGDISVSAENACGIAPPKKITINTPCQIQATGNPANNELSAYPNPAHELLNIQLNLPYEGNGIIQITDLQGKLIWSDDVSHHKGNNEYRVNLSEIQNGMYQLLFLSNDVIKLERFVKN